MIIITGCAGRLGTALISHMTKNGISHRGFAHEDLDVTDDQEIADVLWRIRKSVDFVVNCAGILSMQSEQDRYLAWRTNAIGAGNLANVCNNLGLRLAHISSDYVFDGEHGMYTEVDPPNPVNYYGLTKAAGEAAVLSAAPYWSIVLRVPFRYNPPWPYQYAFADQWISGRWVHEVAPDIIEAARMKGVNGVLHIGGPRRNLLDMAREASPDVRSNMRKDWTGMRIPKDVSLDSSLWRKLRNGGQL